jgi:predicted GNAT family acetyltransferase
MSDAGSPTVRHEPESRRFVIDTPSGLALIDYRIAGGVAVMPHTFVPPEQEGRGLGARLVRAALAFAREEGLRVDPRCPFVAAYFRRHPDEQDLLLAPLG